MSPQEKKELAKLWALLGEYYGRPVSDTVLKMYLEDVADLPLPEICRALREYRLNPKNRVPPLPADVRERVQPESRPMSSKAIAVESAARIVAAINKFGYVAPLEARKFMGELAWEVVEMQGGWLRQCESEQPTGVIQAHYTRLAEALIERSMSGDSRPPALPGRSREAAGEIEGRTLKKIAALLPGSEK